MIQRFSSMWMLAYILSCVKENISHKKNSKKNCLIKIPSAETFRIGEKVQVAKTRIFKRCINLKPHKTKVHLVKFMVIYYFSYLYHVCMSKRFIFCRRSSHFTFGSGCTVTPALLYMCPVIWIELWMQTFRARRKTTMQVYVQVIFFVCKELCRTTDRCPKFDSIDSTRTLNSARGIGNCSWCSALHCWTIKPHEKVFLEVEDPQGTLQSECHPMLLGALSDLSPII